MSRAKPANRLVAITLDEASIGSSSRDVEHERAVAIYDLLEENSFALVGHFSGPFKLRLGARFQFLVMPEEQGVGGWK